MQWQWVFLSSDAVLHKIASRRVRCVAEDVLRRHRTDVSASDRYSGQEELRREHQVCLAHVLSDVQYAIDSANTVFAPHIRDHLRCATKVGPRRDQLKDSTLAAYAAKADIMLDRLVTRPVAHPAGRALLKQIKAWRGKFFVILTNCDVPVTSNISEREIRPSVVFRKVSNGLGSDWGAQIHTGYHSVTGTARLSGQSALSAICDLVDGRFAVA
ncbi:Transposase IS66 family protein [Novosphingobium subterraneum]|uniref:Transposase IS66 family protein n=1 Tax=Novosphingobium subterraneum TaxID=48936 RepID=A0A0B8ZF51_9SPHN|nr:Transposase IS66 family protein [Novosphingobium subterraneum]